MLLNANATSASYSRQAPAALQTTGIKTSLSGLRSGLTCLRRRSSFPSTCRVLSNNLSRLYLLFQD